MVYYFIVAMTQSLDHSGFSYLSTLDSYIFVVEFQWFMWIAIRNDLHVGIGLVSSACSIVEAMKVSKCEERQKNLDYYYFEIWIVPTEYNLT